MGRQAGHLPFRLSPKLSFLWVRLHGLEVCPALQEAPQLHRGHRGQLPHTQRNHSSGRGSASRLPHLAAGPARPQLPGNQKRPEDSHTLAWERIRDPSESLKRPFTATPRCPEQRTCCSPNAQYTLEKPLHRNNCVHQYTRTYIHTCGHRESTHMAPAHVHMHISTKDTQVYSGMGMHTFKSCETLTCALCK